MTQIPKPALDEAIAKLHGFDEYKTVIQFLRDERERFFGDLRQCAEPYEVMRITGSISTIDEVIQLLDS